MFDNERVVPAVIFLHAGRFTSRLRLGSERTVYWTEEVGLR